MKIELDRIDAKLLETIQSSARISNQDLALQVNLSPSACLSRLRRLERQGAIRRYIADLALSELGPCLEVFAEVTLSNHTPSDFKRFEQAILQMPEIVQAYQLSGAFDYLLYVICRDIGHYRQLNDDLANGKHGVGKILSHVVMDESKPFAGYPVSKLFMPQK